jgi:hypothetical protein
MRMNIKNKCKLSVVAVAISVILLMSSTNSYAQNSDSEEVSVNDLSGIQEQSIVFESSSEMTRDAINAFAKNLKIEFGEEDSKGRTFYHASKSVPVDITNPQWAKYRVIAYKKAFNKIKQDFLEASYGEIAGDTLTEYFSDDSDNRMDFPKESDPRAKSKISEIFDKVVALSGAKLDAALKDLDIDPSAYDALPVEARKKLFKDSFTEKSVKKSAGSLAGLMVIKTFEGKDSKGGYTIGVVAMYKKSLKQLAMDIAKGREPMLTKKSGQGKMVSSYIPANKKSLSQSFGVRLVFDENNSPALISYGQWSYMYKGKSQRKIDRGYEHALKKAKTESQKQIAQFMKSTAQFKEMEETSAIEEETAILNPTDGVVRSEDMSSMIDKVSSTMKVQFKADLKGIKVKKRESYKHPSGHEIVMVVSVWSQKNVDQTDGIRNFKHQKRAPAIERRAVPKITEKSTVEEGVGMDLDF